MAIDFNIEETFTQMLGVVKQTGLENAKGAKDIVLKFLNNKKDRFALLAKMKLKGELTEDEFKAELENEKLIADAELNALEAVAKAVAQKAINDAIDVLTKAVFKALPI